MLAHRYFWESIVLLEKLAFGAAVIFSGIIINPGVQLLLALIVVEGMLLLQVSIELMQTEHAHEHASTCP